MRIQNNNQISYRMGGGGEYEEEVREEAPQETGSRAAEDDEESCCSVCSNFIETLMYLLRNLLGQH